jgi:hypothetical protein
MKLVWRKGREFRGIRETERKREAGAYKQFVYLRTTSVKPARRDVEVCVQTVLWESLRKWIRLK